MFNGHEIEVSFLNLETKQAGVVYMDPFLRDCILTNSVNGFLLFTDQYTIAVIPSGDFIFLFDSHSRDARGLSVANGSSVLLKF